MRFLANLSVFSLFAAAVATSTPAVAVMDFLCLSFNLNTSQGGGDGSQLEHAVNVSETVIQCQYSDGDSCWYTRNDGNMQTGSKTCPSSIDPSSYTESQYDCDELNPKQSLLIGTSVTAKAGNLACAYDDGTMCTYSEQDGSLVSGSTGLCPSTVTSSTYCVASSYSQPPSSYSPNVCHSKDNSGEGIISSAPSSDGTLLQCGYSGGHKCMYFISNATLSWGSWPGVCPQTIVPPVAIPGDISVPQHNSHSTQSGSGAGNGNAAAASNNNAAAAGKDLLASEEPVSAKKPISPFLIALLAMNGVLVLGVLILGGVWIVRREGRGTKYQRVGKDNVGDAASVPLTLGAQGSYYDAPEEPKERV
ncbi:hypothetical protein DFH06DRAFT_1298361 [Mycena polygramma]|nr:hypothetical protein DFH06DRAFT_1298361 [Mycena polygramma]